MASGYTSLGADVSGSVPAAAGPDHSVLQFQESNLQTFSPNEARGKLTGSYKPPADVDDNFSKPGPGNAATPPEGWRGYFNIVSYRPYNVDTSNVVERIRDSFLPYRGDFVEKTSINPDIYGPFWICTTLIFVTAALGNLAAYLSTKTSSKGADHWHYDTNKVSWSVGLFYGYIGFIPLALYFLLRYLGISASLVQLWCLYGYSLFVFIPASFLSVGPVEIFKWVIVGIAALISACFLSINLRSHIKTAREKWFLIVVGSFCLQLALALVLKLYFFTVLF